jgi:hypothetical protein
MPTSLLTSHLSSSVTLEVNMFIKQHPPPKQQTKILSQHASQLDDDFTDSSMCSKIKYWLILLIA